MSKATPDISSVGRWFMGNSLPWTEVIETKLLSMGVLCVEHLKECRNDEWHKLFCCESIIAKRVSSRVFQSLKIERAFDPKKCASQLGMAQAETSFPQSTSLSKQRGLKDNGLTQKLVATPWKNFTVQPVKKGLARKKRLKIRSEARAAIAAMMNTA